MDTKKYKEIPFTIEINWEKEEVWLNNHISKEKIVLTKKDAKSIINAFKLINAKTKGLI